MLRAQMRWCVKASEVLVLVLGILSLPSCGQAKRHITGWVGNLQLPRLRERSVVMCSSGGRPPRAVIVGGGASGFMGAIETGRALRAAGLPHGAAEVVLIEGSRQVLQKVRISGGGRCNVMHDKRKPIDEILKAYPRGQRELVGPFKSTFGPAEAYRWFEQEGVALKVEADGRVFPVTDDSGTIIEALRGAAEKAGVQIRTGCKARSISLASPEEGGGLVVGVEEAGGASSTIHCDRLLLATGSSPEGHRLARELGHRIADPVPSLFTLDVKGGGNELVRDMAGVSVRDAQVRLALPASDPETKAMLKALGLRHNQLPATRGPLLFTHSGLSGPAVLKLSAFAARVFHHLKYRAPVEIDWAPSYETMEEVAERLERAKATYPRKAVSTFCPLGVPGEEALLPRRLWAKVVQAAGLGGDEGEGGVTWGAITAKQLRALAAQVHATRVETTGKGAFKEEFVTCGGVVLKEVDLKAMASRVVPGLHLAGELLDIDAITGGYNFMACWTTGWTAGTAMGQALLRRARGEEEEGQEEGAGVAGKKAKKGKRPRSEGQDAAPP